MEARMHARANLQMSMAFSPSFMLATPTSQALMTDPAAATEPCWFCFAQ